MVVSLKTDLRFPIPGQQGHGGRIIHTQSKREKIVYLICKINFRIEIYELYLLYDGKESQQYLLVQQFWCKINIVGRDLMDV